MAVTRCPTLGSSQNGFQDDPFQTAEMQSRKLHVQLTLSLIHTVGPQQALLESGVEDDEDGTMALARLIKHFEYTTKELRILELLEKWQRETLRTGEDPSLLYTKLLNLQRQLSSLGEDFTNTSLIKKFIASVQEGDGKLYESVIDGYERCMVMGPLPMTEQLMELMTIKYRKFRADPVKQEPMMAGLASAERCQHCGKMGHKEDDCWTKHPSKAPERKPKGQRNTQTVVLGMWERGAHRCRVPKEK